VFLLGVGLFRWFGLRQPRPAEVGATDPESQHPG
jgi:hypothetical protein